jgi:N-acetylmuramoyl-L-alanine amidase
MKNIIGLTLLCSVMVTPAWANQSLFVASPPTNYKTTSDRISLIGTAPPIGEVFVNGQAIKRSSSGNFAPQFPLQLGDNVFTLRYQDQELKLKVTRLATAPQSPEGLAFGKNSLTPSVDIARLPGEQFCFGAIAPPDVNVSVQLGNQTIPLTNQQQTVDLPANSAALTQQNQPQAIVGAGHYLGCAAAAAAANLGFPQFQLSKNGATTTQKGSGQVQILNPSNLQVAEVIVDAGVARTGPSTDYARLTPLPKGTRASVTAVEGEWVRLDYGGWINSKEIHIVKDSAPPRSLIRSITTRQEEGKTEVIFPLQVPVPIDVQQGDRTLTLTLYNTTAQTDIIRLNPDPVIERLDWQQVMPGVVRYTLRLKLEQQWGYKLRYDGTSLVLTVRHPPKVSRRPTLFQSQLKTQNSTYPLAGIKILLDPGHGGAETGAEGPTGYPEKDINLIMAKLVAERLISRGASVYLTRQEDKEMSLQDRVAMIDKLEPAISISIHYNSLPDDGDMMNTQGMGAFWYHPQAHSLAVFMHNYIVQKLGRPDYGVFWDNLALARPSSAPSVLLELGFMSNPVEFEWITNPQEQKKLAATLAEGITQWFASIR